MDSPERSHHASSHKWTAARAHALALAHIRPVREETCSANRGFASTAAVPWRRSWSRPSRDHAARDCGVAVFEDPKLAAVTLVAFDGKLALVRRGVEPHLGRWSFPSGYVDRGERVEDAAVRETLEETGLHVRLNGLVGLYSETGLHVAVAVYAAEVVCGKLEAGHDAQGAALFEIGDMPPLPFPHDYRILEDWLEFRSGEAQP